ncbi:hypothetical protein VTK56DRAFT_6381 [Thermocarpiscus australiensis]
MESVELHQDVTFSQESQTVPSPPSSSGAKGEQPPPPPPPPKKTVRKRTKTGCLTCRKRRIKCDEGKPTCSNCIKSKRDCEGYGQRLTFKEPLGSFPSGNPFGHPVYHRHVQPEFLTPQISAAQTKGPPSQESLPVIAPKPPSVDLSPAGPVPFGQGYQGPSTPSKAGSHLPDSPHRRPSPPLLGHNLLDHSRHPIHGEAAAYHDFSRHAAGIQNFQPNPAPERVTAPVTEHHTHVPDRGRSVTSPDAAEEVYWHSDDEASMAESHDDADLDPHMIHLEANDLGIQVARRLEAHHDVYGVRIRSFAGFADGNILATYTPSSGHSPLNDSQTAAVFWYFVNVTAHSMSIYERQPFDPTPMFQGQPVPKQRQHLWTYTFPIVAFNHPALMQAMLALGSLQMAKLQGSPPTAAMKHYHLSLRRVAKNYQSPNRRTQPTTLATTLLLSFYEVWSSDHDKWCKHLWGARAILRDMPLARMTREILALRRIQRQQSHQDNERWFAAHGDPSGDTEMVDAELILQFSGQRVDYHGHSGYVLRETVRRSRLTERDVETYEQLRDLYWWYCKMDVYQSILGGTPLLMEYRSWTQCPPRAPFGKIDAIYGTYDYLMLLLGRLADFASRDLARKRRARKAQASQSPGQGPGQGPAPGPGLGSAQSPPSFPGLMPASGRVTVPRGFSPPRETSPSSDSSDDFDLDASTANAVREWEAIRQAFVAFRARLGPDFEPLDPDVAQPELTPFGPALMYRTYGIAGIWMNYYMGLIVLHRAHPSMPPSAVVAAGMAAQQTGRWANEIGRIVAGLHEDTTHVAAVSTLVGGAFIESSFSLFVAAVQYQDLQQRHWTIRRLRDIARLTGWQSARQIADGCESAWDKAAQLGRGPPYHSPPERGPLFPDSAWNRPRRLDRRIQEELEAGEHRLVLAKSEQAHYALGLLSVEQDLDKLEIDDDGARIERGVADGDGKWK